MTRVAINKDDKDRAILTDALPYETPIIFSNEGLYKYKKKSKTILYQEAVTDENSVAKNLLYPKKGYTIPFEFNISNHSNSVRKLSVVHPKSQLDMAEFYAKFDHQIIHLCSLSPSSLRFPSSVANHYYESSNKSKENNHANHSTRR